MVLDATERHSGAAIRFPRDGTWHEWSFAELGTAVRELARGLPRSGSSPATASRWARRARMDAGRRRDLAGRRRRRRARLPHELARGVPLASTTSGARAIIVEDAAQLEKIEAVRDELPGPRARREHGAGRRHTDGRRRARPRAARSRRPCWRPARGDRPRRRRHDRLHVRHDRPAEGLRAHPPQHPVHGRRVHRAGPPAAARHAVHVPAARARARARGPDGLDPDRRHAGLLERRLAPAGGGRRRREPDPLPVGPARVREDPRARARARRARAARSSSACSRGRSRPAARRAPRCAPATRPPPCAAQYALADRLVLSKVRELFGGGSSSR